MPEPLLQDPVISHVAVTDVGPPFAIPRKRKDPEVTQIVDVEQNDETLSRIWDAAHILAQRVNHMIVGRRTGRLPDDASTSVCADDETTIECARAVPILQLHAADSFFVAQQFGYARVLERLRSGV